jgi:hypothetical protein
VYLHFYLLRGVLRGGFLVKNILSTPGLNEAWYDLLKSIKQELNSICFLLYKKIVYYIKNDICLNYFSLTLYAYLYLSFFVLGSFFLGYVGLDFIGVFILFTLSIFTLTYIYNNKYLINKYPLLSIILISVSLITIVYFIYTISCLHLEILKDFILWARVKYIKGSSSNSNNSNNPGKPSPNKPKADIKSMSPDAKKKHLKSRRRAMDEAYDRTEAGKARNERYRSSEKESISRKNRNARSVAKTALDRKQKEFDNKTKELESVMLSADDDLKEARIEWYQKELASCEARLKECKDKWESLKIS